MRSVTVGTRFSLHTEWPTASFFRVRPANHVRTEESFAVLTGSGELLAPETFTDSMAPGPGQTQLVDRVVLPAGRTEVTYSAVVTEIPEEPDPMPERASAPRLRDLTPEQWWWLQPSRYCRPDELGQEAWNLFGNNVTDSRPATGSTVRSICDYVNESMHFEYGVSTPLWSATDAWYQRRGVCRDFNHIAISFCRALNIPARYVFGYLPDIEVAAHVGPLDFCAWFEVFLDETWWTFDARVNVPRVGRIVIARGRDATDVPMVSTMGPAVFDDFSVVALEVPTGPTTHATPTDTRSRARS